MTMQTESGLFNPPENSAGGGSRWRRSFWCLILTQFQGAFIDNAYKYLILFMIAAMGFSKPDRDLLVLVVGALFALPFVLFSMAGGYLADRYSKRSVTVGTRAAEILVMLVALIALARNDLPLALFALFLVSTQSAFFGPAKYGLLPELLPEKRLSWGNGIIELGTFLAVITGTLIGTTMAGAFRGRQAWSGAILLGLAVIGFFLSLGIDRVPAADPSKRFRVNFLADLIAQMNRVRHDRVLFLAVLGNSYFFFLAALLSLNIIYYGTDVLKLSESQNGYLQAAVAIGIGIGSFAAGHLSGNKIEYGLIPLGSIGIAGFAHALSRPGLSLASMALNLALLGFFAGFFIVPISALIQHRPDSNSKGSVIAAANLLSFAGIFLASGAYFLMTGWLRLDPPAIFLVSSWGTLLAKVYVITLLPDALLRLLLWFIAHSIYRIRVEGRDNIPEKGGALFVSNHLSFVDALLLLTSTDRRVRFLIFKDFYDHPLIKPFARIMRAIPISSQLRPREMIRSLKTASEAIRSGEVVCIFAEGQITRIGQLLPFRRGLERIMKGVEAPIIPVHLDGVWGRIFSFERGRFVWKWPRHVPYRVTISFGRPMAPTATAFEVRQAVQELHSEAYGHRKTTMKTLHRAFVRTARRHPFRFAMADGLVPHVRFGSMLARTVFLARRLRKVWQGQNMVGILLPPSVPGALVNFAALLMGKVPVNLNYTASSSIIASCAKQCEIQTIVKSVS